MRNLSESTNAYVVSVVFEQIVQSQPDRIAIIQGESQLTYAELNGRSNHLADVLRQRGIQEGDVVGLATSRSLEMMVSIVAILKCGAAYLPLDTNNPSERNRYYLEAANVHIVIADDNVVVPNAPSHAVIVTTDTTLFHTIRADAPHCCIVPDSPAYIMFTSGSTGNPKGVVVPHRGIVRLVKETNYITIGKDDVFFQISPTSFDASTFEIWGALLNGATLVLYSGEVFDPNLFRNQLMKYQVSVLWLTAALFHLVVDRFIDALAPLRVLLAGGDVISAKHVNKVLDTIPGITVINGYGPTENTTFTCCHRMTVESRPNINVPIGHPIAGTGVHILDETLSPVAVGEIGELYASGKGVALGYLNESTSNGAFFTNPEIAEGLIYRTGDLVCINQNGAIEFMGRKDHQVKIRGFRVSLEEIRGRLLEVDNICDAAVLLDETPGSGEQMLVAHVQIGYGSELQVADIKRHLALKLPKYMIPDVIRMDTNLPINKNGKIDRNRIRGVAPLLAEAESGKT